MLLLRQRFVYSVYKNTTLHKRVQIRTYKVQLVRARYLFLDSSEWLHAVLNIESVCDSFLTIFITDFHNHPSVFLE